MKGSGETVKFSGSIQYVEQNKEYAVYGELIKKGCNINGKYYVLPDDNIGGININFIGTIRGEVRDGQTITLRTFRSEHGVEIKKTEVKGLMKKGSLSLDGRNAPGLFVRWNINLTPIRYSSDN